MTERLSISDVKDIAQYTRIGVDDDELPQLTEQLNSIIEELQPIKEYDLSGVEPTFHPIGNLKNIYREDVAVAGFTREEALMNAPKSEDGSFVIPSILGQGGDN